MRAPNALVVDASILISATIGRSRGVLSDVGRALPLLTSERAAEEAARRIALGLQRPELLPVLAAIVGAFDIVANSRLDLAEAEATLRDATPGRTGAISDAHLLALAWEADAEIWSHDRDFAGTGVASWSTLNLLRALAATGAYVAR